MSSSILVSAIVAVIVAILAIYVIGLLAASIVLPAIIWTLLKLVVGIVTVVYILRLFGVVSA